MISFVNLVRKTSSRWGFLYLLLFYYFYLLCYYCIFQVRCSVLCLGLRRTATRTHREKHERARTHDAHTHTHDTHTQGAIRLQRAIMHKAFEIMQDKSVQKFAHAGFTCSRFIAGRDNQV